MTTLPQQQDKVRIQALAPFRPIAWQLPPIRDRSSTVLLTGSAGGGKSKLAAEKLHAYCLKYPGAMALVLRKVKVSMTSGAVLMLARKVIGSDPRVRHYPSKSRFEYDNGSILAYAGLEDERQRERLKSIGQDGAVDIAWMEESTEFEESDYNALLARMRGKAAPWRQIILTCNPDAPTHWIKSRLIDGGEAIVYYSGARDNPYNPEDYRDTLSKLTGVDYKRLVEGQWIQATGMIYDVWSDSDETGNVTLAAEFEPDAGDVYWAVDDGYAGKLDAITQLYTADSHPRVFLLVQLRHDGRLAVFAEQYATQTLSETQIADVLTLGYPEPNYCAIDKSAAELRGRLHNQGFYTRNGPGDVEESIKELHHMLAKDQHGWRRILVHPRCRHLRAEMASYRRDDATGKPVKAFDHGPDALRYLAWSMRFE